MSDDGVRASLPASAAAKPTDNLVRQLMALREDWLAHLQAEYKVKVSRSACERLVSLKYDQIESPMREAIVQQCRGMVVDLANRKVLAWPYDKFWNHGEALADAIDWSSAQVLEKLDGSLMILFYDEHKAGWSVASSGHPTAGGSFGSDSERTFKDAFWQVFRALGMQLPDTAEWAGTCFMFELCAQENRVVVQHERPRLVVHGARHADTGRELSLPALEAVAARYQWEPVRRFPISSIEECLAAAAEIDGLQMEGFVVVDAHQRRVKIKSPRYVALHHMKGEATPRRAIELWQTGETSELLNSFPEMAELILPIHEVLDKAAADAYARAAELCANKELTQKDYALAVKDEPWSAIAFNLRKLGSFTLDDAKRIARAQSSAALERLVERAGIQVVVE
jgi:hypothetical protein